MGSSVRSPTHRYTRWISWPDGPVAAEELYDYGRVAGPRDGSAPFVESRNRIDDPAMTAVRDDLLRGLDEILAARGGPPTAGAVRHPGSAAEPGPLLLYSAPDTDDTAHKARRDVTVWLSRDDGRSWPAHRRIRAGPSAYSDLAVLPDGSVLCIYESGLEGVGPQDGKQRDWGYAGIAVTRFDLDWLVSGEPDAHR